jgi:eukaryotic-like serine/threonine-protein kinase
MTKRLGRYELVKRLGGGSMSDVFLARVPGEPSPPVVLKCLLPHLAANREFGLLFLNEVGIAARLVHPNASRVIELGEADGVFFYTMEFIEGADLRALGLLPVEFVVRIVADAARALDAAHTARDSAGRPLGIVHADVSPKNLLVGVDGLTRLIDFGMARLAGAAGSRGGTYEYMAPEQALDGVSDAKTDQFSLGIVLWEQLTGRRLFTMETDVETLDQVVECHVTPARRTNSRVPEVLDAIVMRMLEKEPAHRFDTCAEVVTVLERWLADVRAGNVTQALSLWMTAHSTSKTPAAVEPVDEPTTPARELPVTPLSDDEEAVLRQLSTMAEPFTLEAIEAGVRLGPGSLPLLDVAQALVERGLLVRDGDLGFRTKWPMTDEGKRPR